MQTIKNQCMYVHMYTSKCTHRKAQTVHIRIHVHSPGFTEFQGLSAGHCQSQFCSDQPVWCALLLSASGEIEERKWVIERGVEGCVIQQATGISMICMDLPLTNTWQRERLKDGRISFPPCLSDGISILQWGRQFMRQKCKTVSRWGKKNMKKKKNWWMAMCFHSDKPNRFT